MKEKPTPCIETWEDLRRWMVGTMERAIGGNNALAIKCFMWRKEEYTLRNTKHPNKTYHQPARAAAIFMFRILLSKACYTI